MPPTMMGRPFLSCVASHSRVMVPELPGMVTRSAACAPPAPTQGAQARNMAAVAGLLEGSRGPGREPAGDWRGGAEEAGPLKLPTPIWDMLARNSDLC